MILELADAIAIEEGREIVPRVDPQAEAAAAAMYQQQPQYGMPGGYGAQAGVNPYANMGGANPYAAAGGYGGPR